MGMMMGMIMGMMMRAVREGSRSGARRAEGVGHGREEGGGGGGRRRGRGRRGQGQTRPRIGGVRARGRARRSPRRPWRSSPRARGRVVRSSLPERTTTRPARPEPGEARAEPRRARLHAPVRVVSRTRTRARWTLRDRGVRGGRRIPDTSADFLGTGTGVSDRPRSSRGWTACSIWHFRAQLPTPAQPPARFRRTPRASRILARAQGSRHPTPRPPRAVANPVDGAPRVYFRASPTRPWHMSQHGSDAAERAPPSRDGEDEGCA